MEIDNTWPPKKESKDKWPKITNGQAAIGMPNDNLDHVEHSEPYPTGQPYFYPQVTEPQYFQSTQIYDSLAINESVFVEEEHPRDKDGKFTDKNSSSRVQIGTNTLDKQIEYLKTLIKQIPEKRPFEPYSEDERRWKYENEAINKEIEKLMLKRDFVRNIDDKIPLMPMGKNTHPINDQGFRSHPNLKITIRFSEEDNPDSYAARIIAREKMALEFIKMSGNEMPDEDRELVDSLVIEPPTGVSKTSSAAGVWDWKNREMAIRLDGYSDLGEHTATMIHEFGHARWHDILDKNPEKIEAWKKATMKRAAPTPYSEEHRKRMNHFKFGGADLLKKEPNHPKADTVRRNMQITEDLYFNELHSEVTMAMMGQLHGMKASTPALSKKMEPFLEPWRELRS